MLMLKLGIGVAVGLLAPLFAWLLAPALIGLAVVAIMSLPVLALIVLCKRVPGEAGVVGVVVEEEIGLDGLDISTSHQLTA